MRFKPARSRKSVVAIGVLIAMSVITIATAAPVSASTVAPGNTVLNAGGSETDYTAMQQLSDLYNSAPGCQLLAANQSNNQELDYHCASSYTTAAPGDEGGYSLAYSPLNPYNDVVYQEPALGSANGIKELELEGADTPGSPPDNLIAPVDFSRSARAAVVSGAGDDKSGLNFVAYAENAIPWFHFTKVKNSGTTCSTGTTATPSASVTSLTTTQLNGIYTGTITNWSAVGGANAPIDVFISQLGTDTEYTWQADLALTGSYPFGGVSATAARLGLPVSDFEIFQNEVGDIFANPAAFGTQQAACNAVFFISYGQGLALCPKPRMVCIGTPVANQGTEAAFGEINGVKADQTTIQNGAFVTDYQISNVYADGSNPKLPFAGSPPSQADQAAMNFVSTYGFLCNPATYDDVDPLSPTGATYGAEIDGIITANGDFPFPLGVEGDSSIMTPPSFSDPGYAAASPPPSGDKGYCRVTTTDGDGNN